MPITATKTYAGTSRRLIFLLFRRLILPLRRKAGYELDDVFGGFIAFVAHTRPDGRMIAIGDHRDLDVLVARGLHRRRELDVLLAPPVLIAIGVEDQHRRRAGLQMMRGRRVHPDVAIVAPHAPVAVRRNAAALDPVERTIQLRMTRAVIGRSYRLDRSSARK